VGVGDGRLGTCGMRQNGGTGGINTAGTCTASSPLFTATLIHSNVFGYFQPLFLPDYIADVQLIFVILLHAFADSVILG